MPNADEVVDSMCLAYAAAVSANDSEAYAALFADDAIRIPPGAEPEYGPSQIKAGEQADYDVATWTITSTRRDAIDLDGGWVFGLADVDVKTVAHADGAERAFRATKTWLLRQEPSGDWRIVRQMWNLR